MPGWEWGGLISDTTTANDEQHLSIAGEVLSFGKNSVKLSPQFLFPQIGRRISKGHLCTATLQKVTKSMLRHSVDVEMNQLTKTYTRTIFIYVVLYTRPSSWNWELEGTLWINESRPCQGHTVENRTQSLWLCRQMPNLLSYSAVHVWSLSLLSPTFNISSSWYHITGSVSR